MSQHEWQTGLDSIACARCDALVVRRGDVRVAAPCPTTDTDINQQVQLTAGADDAVTVDVPEMDGVAVIVTRSVMDGALLVMIDTASADKIRVVVNDGNLADITNGGDTITLPEHCEEFIYPA